MKNVLLMAVLSILFFLPSAYALQGSYTFTELSYFRAAMPYIDVVLDGYKGICGCEGVNNMASWDPRFDVDYCQGIQKDFENGGNYNMWYDAFYCSGANGPNDPRTLSSNPYMDRIPVYVGSPSGGGNPGFNAEISIPEDSKIVGSDGSIIADTVCVGDSLTLEKGADRGEFWNDGGHEDSPPIFWVDDVEAFADKLISNPITLKDLSQAVLGIPTVNISYKPRLEKNSSYQPGAWDNIIGNVVCSIKDKSGGATTYKAEKAGFLQVDKVYTVECMAFKIDSDFDSHYLDTGLGDYVVVPSIIQNNISVASPDDLDCASVCHNRIYKSKEDFFSVGFEGINRTLKVVSPTQPQVDVSVAGTDKIKFGESNTLRFLVKNTGDINVSIKSVYSKPEGKLISCDSQELAPNQQAECLLSVTPVQGQGLSIQASYDYKSCGKSQVGLVTKTLIKSKTVRPVLKEQSYLMGVHGACDNSYFSCYSASEGSLFAGYKCFKTANGFYAPATERFNLRFDLSDIPKNAEILGAKLYLKASESGGKQTVNVYSVNKIPEAVKCLPGGDICTKPYCGECKPLYELDGTVASSAEVSSAGQYSFDVTNQVEDKLIGDGTVSLQIRGAEGLWESLGQSSCTVENDWDKKDISFDAGGRDGPYLEVVYR